MQDNTNFFIQRVFPCWIKNCYPGKNNMFKDVINYLLVLVLVLVLPIGIITYYYILIHNYELCIARTIQFVKSLLKSLLNIELCLKSSWKLVKIVFHEKHDFLH